MPHAPFHILASFFRGSLESVKRILSLLGWVALPPKEAESWEEDGSISLTAAAPLAAVSAKCDCRQLGFQPPCGSSVVPAGMWAPWLPPTSSGGSSSCSTKAECAGSQVVPPAASYLWVQPPPPAGSKATPPGFSSVLPVLLPLL